MICARLLIDGGDNRGAKTVAIAPIRDTRGDLMSQEDVSKSGIGGKTAEPVAVRIDRALVSLGKAEINLRNLHSRSLPEMAGALAMAASDLESLRGAFFPLEPGRRADVTIRTRLKKLEYATGRVCALYGAARRFHEGLALVRKMEAGAYDARGEVRGMTSSRLFPHRLETRG